MLNKTFSVRSNAIRNARSQLGKSAQQGVHFSVGGEKGAYTWSPVNSGSTAHSADLAAVAGVDDSETLADAKQAVGHPTTDRTPTAKSARKRPVKKTGRKAGRKQITSVSAVSGKRLKMFKLISGTKGASLDTLTNALGWQKHTVRGAVSTIASQFKVKIKSFRDARRGRVYQVSGRPVAA